MGALDQDWLAWPGGSVQRQCQPAQAPLEDYALVRGTRRPRRGLGTAPLGHPGEGQGTGERRRRYLEHDVAYARAITAYLGDTCDLPAAGLTRDGIQQAMGVRSVPDGLTDRLLACLDWADSGCFAPVAAGQGVCILVKEAEEIIIKLEEKIT